MKKRYKVILGEGVLEIVRGTGDSILLWETPAGPQNPIKKTKWEGARVRLIAEILE